MSIEFYGEEFDKYERSTSKPYMGYISPDGQLVNYNTALGGSHGDLGNIVSWTFLLWIKQENIVNELNLKNIDTMARLYPESGRIKNADIACYEFNEKSNLLLLQRDLLRFLEKAGDSEDFKKFVNSKIDLDEFPKYIINDRKLPLSGESVYEIESLFGRENTRRLLLILKDICVQCLGYDAIEKIKTDNKELILPQYYYLYPEDYLTYFDKPRKISTSYNNLNERFYNYLLMDWKIQKLSKYYYNEDTKRIIVDSSLFQSDKDMNFEKEIETIKKHVPLRERINHFR